MRHARSRLQGRSRFYNFAVAAFAALAALSLGSASSSAASWEEFVLWTFCSQSGCSDGLKPQGGVVIEPDGDLWGTTLEGGKNNAGVVFDVVMPGVTSTTESHDEEIIFYNFCQTPSKKLICSDGAWPTAGLAAGRLGNFYGTTYTGGSGGPRGSSGGGTVFALLPGGQFETLHEFCKVGPHCLDGASPAYGLLSNALGTDFYGTTVNGGRAVEAGTIFKVTSSGRVSTLYHFCSSTNCKDGQTPSGGLISDPKGNLYGTTAFGGANSEGAVFELTPSGVYKVLYSFCPSSPCTDGQQPAGTLARDSSGNLYGTASAGGAHGHGAVFQIVPGSGGSPSTENVFYDFCPGGTPCVDGSSPSAGVVISLSGTNLYGTTVAGGTTDQGTVFEVPIVGGSESVLHSFCASNEPVCTDSFNNPDGSTPSGPLTLDDEGNIFGTTDTGGGNTTGAQAGGGTLFELVNPSPGT
jgi:uncharacterized repeat protein (TIGR03803 family)